MKELGPGFGVRKNRYLIEVSNPLVDDEKLNILCRSASFPERNISTTDVWHKGRRYTVRGEVDYGGEFEIVVVDDSNMSLRKLFDNWLKIIDDSNPGSVGNLLSGYISGQASSVINRAKKVLGVFGASSALYQTDINVWQMARPGVQEGVDKQKVYGYKLENAFPKAVSSISLEDSEENTLSEFSVTFAFSEFTPLQGA